MKSYWILNVFAALGAIVFIFWICAFKIFDSDFFWHVTAGRIMRETGWLITTDPFSYAREGLPYLANHEWGAQVILSLVFDWFGVTGVILFRSFLVSVAAVIILLIGRKNFGVYVPLVMFAALTIRGGAMDRPHLWTWVKLAEFLYLCAFVLRQSHLSTRDVVIFIVLQIFWVNLHGGAALLGVVITSALCLQLFVERRSFSWQLLLPAGLILAMLISPLAWENIAYLSTLLTDKTTRFIAEWQPREFSAYIKDLWPFWIAALSSLILIRKHFLFSIIVLAATGWLSLSAYRHEMLFVLAATAIFILQLEESERWKGFIQRRFMMPIVGLFIIALIFYSRSVNLAFANRYHAHRYGIIDRTADASAFLERENLTGNIFNTYNLGSELLFHFHPDRKVFVDGRNVDYGEEFLQQLFAAASDQAAWKRLEEKYQFAIAIIDNESTPYVKHLEADPQWSLIFLDDAVAMYIKNDEKTANVVKQWHYVLLTPENFLSGKALQNPSVETELKRAVEQTPHGTQARLLLARLYIAQGRTQEAEPLVMESTQRYPHEYRPYEMLGLLRAREGKYDEAEEAFDQAISRLSSEAAATLRQYVAQIFESLGQPDRAERY